MNCLEFRRAVGAQPDTTAADVVAHAAQCPACARYQQELQRMDPLIHRALEIDVVPHRAVRRRRAVQWGLAASVLVAVLAGLVLWIANPRETLAEQVIEHTNSEAFVMVRTSWNVDPAQVALVLSRSGVHLRSDAMAVSYATTCRFRGRQVPHLVVQTERGPVTVLLLAHEKGAGRIQKFNEGGYQGAIVAAPRGVLAVLGRDVPAEDIAAKVLAAVDYDAGG